MVSGQPVSDTTSEVNTTPILRVAVDESPPPPLCFGRPGEPAFCGFEVDLVVAVCRRLGMSVQWTAALWRDALDRLNACDFDMICTAATITPERMKVVSFSDPYLTTQLAIVSRSKAEVSLPGDLHNCRVGVRAATVAADYLTSHQSTRNITYFDLNTDAYDALVARTLDVIVDDRPIADGFARAIGSLRVAPMPDTSLQYGMVFRLGEQLLRGRVNDALAELIRDGTLAAMRDRWRLTESVLVPSKPRPNIAVRGPQRARPE